MLSREQKDKEAILKCLWMPKVDIFPLALALEINPLRQPHPTSIGKEEHK